MGLVCVKWLERLEMQSNAGNIDREVMHTCNSESHECLWLGFRA